MTNYDRYGRRSTREMDDRYDPYEVRRRPNPSRTADSRSSYPEYRRTQGQDRRQQSYDRGPSSYDSRDSGRRIQEPRAARPQGYDRAPSSYDHRDSGRRVQAPRAARPQSNGRAPSSYDYRDSGRRPQEPRAARPQSYDRGPSSYNYRNSGRRPQGPEPSQSRPSRYEPYGYDANRYYRTKPQNGSYSNPPGKKRKKKKHSKGLFIFLAIIVVLLAVGVFLMLPVVRAKGQANSLKHDLELVLSSAKSKDPDAAEKALEKSYQDKEKLAASLDSSYWKTLAKIPRVSSTLDVARELLDILTDAQDNMLRPLVNLMKEQPLTELKVGEDGFNVTLINHYLDFAEEKIPQLESLADRVMQLDETTMVGGMVGSYKEKLGSYLDAYYEASALLPLLRTILGNGEDRLYLFAAQNSAEIRASGGFPGSIGTIRVQDGVLTIGDFASVYNVLAPFVSYETEITETELEIFGSWVEGPRDACFNPAFDRTAQSWAIGYEDYLREGGAIEHYNEDGTVDRSWHGVQQPFSYAEDNLTIVHDGVTRYVEYVDGVISLTPAIIQMLLEDVGEISLYDGTVMTAENATRILQYDLYHKYYDRSVVSDISGWYADTLFAETAKTAMSRFVSSFEISKFADYYKLFKRASEEHILMMWMADEEEEQVMVDAGVSGKLNYNSSTPQNGIYFSLADPSKLGWYVDLIPEVGEPVINDDGSRTYDVKLTVRNTIDDNEIDRSDEYIIGSYGGKILCFLHIFGPYGGYLSDVEAENPETYLSEGEYKDLDVYYTQYLMIDPGEEEVFHYKVTTAEDVETPLEIVTTPTLMQYR